MKGRPGGSDEVLMVVPCVECGEGVPIGEWTLEIVQICNSICDRKGWARLKKGEVVYCDTCGRRRRIEMDRQSGEAAQILKELNGVVMSGGSPMETLAKAPAWFRQGYGDEVADIIKAGERYSNRDRGPA